MIWYKITMLLFCVVAMQFVRGHRGHDRMVVGFITSYAISAYYH
jgi:hypothetical protein